MYRVMLILWACLALSAGFTYAQQGGGLYDSVEAAELDPAPVIEWVNLLYDRIYADGVNAPAAARLYGYASVTLYEAVLPGMPDNNTLIGQIVSLTELPWPTEDDLHDWLATADGALYTVLSGLFVDSPDSQRAFRELRDAHIAAREEATSPAIVERSVAFGETLGRALLDWIAEDGYIERVTEYTPPPDDPSTWVPTREGQRAVEPGWGSIRTLVLPDPDACAILPDVPFSTDENSVFYAQAMEVMTTAQNLTQEQREIAEYWVDTPGLSGTPAGHWVHIAGLMIGQEGFMLNRAAELYAMVGMTVMDSFIATWSLKYQLPLLRPVTYINEYINPRWRPHIESPGFPEYPSGHSTVSASAAAVLTSYFDGPRAFAQDNSSPTGEMLTRSFTSFWAAANEAAISRLYGGIHYRSAIENGVMMGECIGNYIVDRIRLNPIRQGE
jgi:membrane-associated phospholipid phosphatase